MIFPKKPQILYAPMLGTFGGGSMRSFGRGTGGSIEFLDRTTDFPGAMSSIQQHGNHYYPVTTQTHVLWMGVTSGGAVERLLLVVTLQVVVIYNNLQPLFQGEQ